VPEHVPDASQPHSSSTRQQQHQAAQPKGDSHRPVHRFRPNGTEASPWAPLRPPPLPPTEVRPRPRALIPETLRPRCPRAPTLPPVAQRGFPAHVANVTATACDSPCTHVAMSDAAREQARRRPILLCGVPCQNTDAHANTKHRTGGRYSSALSGCRRFRLRHRRTRHTTIVTAAPSLVPLSIRHAAQQALGTHAGAAGGMARTRASRALGTTDSGTTRRVFPLLRKLSGALLRPQTQITPRIGVCLSPESRRVTSVLPCPSAVSNTVGRCHQGTFMADGWEGGLPNGSSMGL
jgi:hypothetical protein